MDNINSFKKRKDKLNHYLQRSLANPLIIQKSKLCLYVQIYDEKTFDTICSALK